MSKGVRTSASPALVCTVLLIPSMGAAQEDPLLTGNLSLSSDYVFRGISQTDESVQLQGDLSWSHPVGLYAGVWSTNTNVGGEGNSIEFDPYVGFAGPIGDTDFSYDVGYWHYFYPNSEGDFDFGEFYAIPTFSTGPWTVDLELWYALDYFGSDFFEDVSSLAYAGNVTYAFDQFSVMARLGQQTFDEPAELSGQDYVYYDLGVSGDWRGVTLEVSWHDTDGVEPELADPDWADGRLVFGISRAF